MTLKEKLEEELKLVHDQIRRMNAGEWPVGNASANGTMAPPNVEEMEDLERRLADELERISS